MTRHETLISDVLITWILISCLGQRLEHPGGDAGIAHHAGSDDAHLGHLVVDDDVSGAELLATSSTISSARGRSSRLTLKTISVVCFSLVVCTIMSTLIASCGQRRKDPVRHAGPVGHVQNADLGDVHVVGDAHTTISFSTTRSSRTRVPSCRLKLERTWIGTPYFAPNSTARELEDQRSEARHLEHLAVARCRQLAGLGDHPRDRPCTPRRRRCRSRTLGAFSAAARATAVVSDPPRPSVVMS